MFPEWSWVLGFVIGAAIGSFLNVVVYRTPRNIPLYKPASSFCPKCNHSLGPRDLVPLLSWLASRGKCRYCGQPVASRYFWVEVLTGLIFAGVWYQYLIVGEDWVRAIVYMGAAATLVAIIFIDWELYIIPDQVNAFLWMLGIGYNFYLLAIGSPHAMLWGMPVALAGWLVGVGVLWGIAFLGRVLFRKDAMGHGDIKMARGIGALLGPGPAAISFGLAVFLGAVLGAVQAFARKPVEEEAGDDEEEDPGPESIGSLAKSGIGYVLCFDIIGLFLPKFYEKWFGESPYEPIEEMEEFPIANTMIPFGPYLALGAIVTAVFQSQLTSLVENYLKSASAGMILWEHWYIR